MINIIGHSGSGKTQKLVQKASELGATVVCKDVGRMLQKIEAYGYLGVPCIDYTEYLMTKDVDTKYMVDDVEEFLLFINKGTVGFTANND